MKPTARDQHEAREAGWKPSRPHAHGHRLTAVDVITIMILVALFLAGAMMWIGIVAP